MGRFYSDELEEGIRLLYFQGDTGKYPEGVRLIEKAVENNEPDAFYFLARCYAWGDGGFADSKENDAKALELSKRGAELGSSLAVLGADRFSKLEEVLPYMNCTHLEAFENVMGMANEGNAMAMYAVGLVYYWGDVIGLPKYNLRSEKDNSLVAMRWFERAAAEGCIPAFINAYVARSDGKNSVPKDIAASLDFVERVKDKCQIPVMQFVNIGNDYERIGRLDKMIEWYLRGVEGGDSTSVICLAISYEKGSGVPKDEVKAFDLYHKAAEMGRTDGKRNVGRCYFYGIGTREDKVKALDWFRKAAEGRDGYSQYHIAKCYDEGIGGVAQDFAQSRNWAEKAVQNGYNNAKYYVGKGYYYGYGVKQNYSIAFRNLSDIKNADAYMLLGRMYEEGLGVDMNYEKAVEYYQKAKDMGYGPEAEKALAGFKRSIFGKLKKIK